MWYAVDRGTTPKESAMAREQPDPSGERIVIVRGADDQRAALERLWAQGDSTDLQQDEDAWDTVRRALNESRRGAGARLLFEE